MNTSRIIPLLVFYVDVSVWYVYLVSVFCVKLVLRFMHKSMRAPRHFVVMYVDDDDDDDDTLDDVAIFMWTNFDLIGRRGTRFLWRISFEDYTLFLQDCRGWISFHGLRLAVFVLYVARN